MAIDKKSTDWNLGLLLGFALGAGHKDVQGAVDHILECFAEGDAEEGEEVENEVRTGPWQEDELELLQAAIDEKLNDDAIVEKLTERFGRKQAYIRKQIDKARA